MQESQGQQVIWFLKSEKLGPAGEADPYRQAFTEANFDCFFLPVLGFNYINHDQLEIKLKSILSYSGIIFTSQRAASAVEKLNPATSSTFPQNFPIFAVVRTPKSLFHIETNSFKSSSCLLPSRVRPQPLLPARLYRRARTLFSRATVTRLKCLRISKFDMRKVLSSSLSCFCLATFDGTFCIIHTKFVLFSWSILIFIFNFRDELPSAMRDAEIPFEELHVYETVRQGIDANQDPVCSSTISSFPAPRWIVFFSPSGVESFLHLVPLQENATFWTRTLRASIGKTTAAAMQAEGSWMEPHATAAFPNPQSLLEAIKNVKSV